MGYTALYRKFRPMTFSEMVGQEHITRTLKNQIMANRVGHAYLFNGGRGTGKTSAAKILARAINCLHTKDGEPCNECEICKGAMTGSLTDIVEMDAASNNSVEDIRSIREEVNFLPTKAKYRVYIIDEVHMLSTGAFNALLKTLELAFCTHMWKIYSSSLFCCCFKASILYCSLLPTHWIFSLLTVLCSSIKSLHLPGEAFKDRYQQFLVILASPVMVSLIRQGSPEACASTATVGRPSK